jgi:chromosome segregation ATPase
VTLSKQYLATLAERDDPTIQNLLQILQDQKQQIADLRDALRTDEEHATNKAVADAVADEKARHAVKVAKLERQIRDLRLELDRRNREIARLRSGGVPVVTDATGPPVG